MTKKTMNAKKLLVSLVVIASALFFVATVSAAEIATNTLVEVEGMNAYSNSVAVVAGNTIVVKVEFNALQDDSDVTLEAELEGEKISVDAISTPFDVENGSRYVKTLTMKVPYELKDALSDDLTLSIEIDGKSHKSTLADVTLSAQRPSYNADIKSVTASQSVEAGETFPVDIVLKNRGYNDLDDVYVTVKISELGILKTAYFGDLVAIEDDTSDDDEEEDTVSGRIYLSVPYDVKAGAYALEVEIENEDTTSKATQQIVVENDFTSNVITASSSKTISAGKSAVYELLIVNPTNKLKVYTVVPESNADLASSADNAVVAVPAGSSKTVQITATANKEGTYTFNVNVLSGNNAEKAALNLNVQGKNSTSNPVVILTVVLAIIFLVLLVVLIVLLGKKPSQAEEFGERYY